MASQLSALTIAAPGFFGLNTQDSGITMSNGFALEATNCIIDKFGRIGARNGWLPLSNTSASVTGAIKAITEYTATDGSLEILFTANNKLWKLDSNNDPVELTADDTSAITITDDNWQIASYNNHSVFVQDGHNPVYYDGSADTYKEYTSVPFTQPHCVASCFNRMWAGEDYTVYWSKILEPQSFSGVGTGQLNVREIFGEDDRVVAITSYNNRLVIFGRRNIAFFSGGEDPTSLNFQMTDHIKGIGCIARDSVQNVGTDVVFLSSEGVRSIGRVIQEQSSPIGDVSKNVRDDLVNYITTETEYTIKSVYSPIDSFYLLTIPSSNITYCFDMRTRLEDNSRRVTTWTGISPMSFCVRNDNTLLLGETGYVGYYTGYTDNGSTYRLAYYTSYLDLGSPINESLLKKIRLSLIGSGQQTGVLKWAFDYNSVYRNQSFQLADDGSSEYNVDEYYYDDGLDLEAEYSSGIILGNLSLNTGGRGAVVQFGIEVTINGGALSIQKMDIFAKNGKLIA
jgi:hypothetical protein